MKRVYLIGAALLLLAFIAGDIYFTQRHSTNETIAQGPASLNGSPTSPADNIAQTPPVIDNTPPIEPASTPAPVALLTTRRHYARHYTHSTRNTNLEGALIPNGSTPIALNENTNTEIGTEKSKDFFGNVPARTTTVAAPAKTRSSRSMPLRGLGVEVGFNQSAISNTQSIAAGNVFAGLLYEFNIGDHFALQPGLRYITKGTKLENDDASTQEILKTHYLELPVNAVFKMGKVGNVRMIAGGGPYAAYLVNAKDKFSGPVRSEIPDQATPTPQYNTGNINSFSWGAGGFVGCQAPGGIFVKAGAETDFSGIIKNNAATDRNYNFMVSLGYVIGGN